MEIKTNIKVGDKVWWVKERYTKKGKVFRVYEATVENIQLCEYQGALYCELHCPDFKLNPYPNVHYSFVFPTREKAGVFRDWLKNGGDEGIPMCWGCKYAWQGRG